MLIGGFGDGTAGLEFLVEFRVEFGVVGVIFSGAFFGGVEVFLGASSF